jgi:iron complex transport system ATP-binding protein
MIDGVEVTVDAEAVVVQARQPLRVVSSAVAGGGLGPARSIVNLHVPRGFRCEDTPAVLDDVVRRRALAAPWVGLLTAAPTDRAETATAAAGPLTAVALVTVGLGHTVTAGLTAATAWAPSTINAILVVDADAEPAALVNLVVTVTEVKALALAEAGVRSGIGEPASGTSTDAVVVAATGRGAPCRFGGPASELGAVAARAMRTALRAGIGRWVAEHR